MAAALKNEVLSFWFGSVRTAKHSPESMQTAFKTWMGLFDSDHERLAFDEQIRSRFETLVGSAAQGECDFWCNDPEGILAFCILCDQLPRNIFRGSPKAFAMDTKVVATLRPALAQKLDEQINIAERLFVYLPLMHSESLEDHALASEKMEDLVQAAKTQPEHIAKMFENASGFLVQHTTLIERFGRYPHRNKVLGRANTPAEEEYLSSSEFTSFGQ